MYTRRYNRYGSHFGLFIFYSRYYIKYPSTDLIMSVHHVLFVTIYLIGFERRNCEAFKKAI
ncbi:unnamed protein product [Tenebrio molitor]|nr:unnamed protein product [Tenebrio molitor]